MAAIMNFRRYDMKSLNLWQLPYEVKSIFVSVTEEEVRHPEEDVRIYCICRRPAFGLMISCTNRYCRTRWFHSKCSGQGLNPDTYDIQHFSCIHCSMEKRLFTIPKE